MNENNNNQGYIPNQNYEMNNNNQGYIPNQNYGMNNNNQGYIPNEKYGMNNNNQEYVPNQNYGMNNNNQGYIPNQNYGMNNNNQAIPVNNQYAPDHQDLQSLQLSLKTDPVPIKCPHCNNFGITSTEKECNCLNLCCCYYTGLIPWIIMQACRGKELNCYNSKHTCQKCGKFIGEKNAC